MSISSIPLLLPSQSYSGKMCLGFQSNPNNKKHQNSIDNKTFLNFLQ